MRREYLKSNRLEDILFLIQHLGLGQYCNLQKGVNPSSVPPRSAKTWADMARKHPELFKVTASETTSLTMRYLHHENEGKKGTPEPLKPETVQDLMKTAMDLHERQARGAEVWKVWVTLIAAMAAAISSVANWFVG